MIFFWDTVRSGKGHSGSARGGDSVERIVLLLPDGETAWEFQDDIPILVTEKALPQLWLLPDGTECWLWDENTAMALNHKKQDHSVDMLLPGRQEVWLWDADYYILLK